MYRTIEELIDLIEEPNRSISLQILSENRELFQIARGSTNNHQTWEGGYIDHVTDGMNIAVELYSMLVTRIKRPLPFSLSDALFIFYLHDIEKPWRITILNGEVINRPGLETKEQFKTFRENKLTEYGIILTPEQQNALTYVEGEYKDYSSKRRVMNELAAFCHMVDVYSARIGYDYPGENGDNFSTGRIRIKNPA